MCGFLCLSPHPFRPLFVAFLIFFSRGLRGGPQPPKGCSPGATPCTLRCLPGPRGAPREGPPQQQRHQNPQNGPSEPPILGDEAHGEDGAPLEAALGGPLCMPAALLLQSPEALRTFFAVREEASGCMRSSSSSSNAALAALRRGSAAAGPAATRGDSGVSAAFDFDGREGLADFFRAAGVPTIILGSGRRSFCLVGAPCSSREASAGGPQRRRRGAPKGPPVSATPLIEGCRKRPPVSAVKRDEGETGMLLPQRKAKRMVAALRFAHRAGDH